MNFLVFLVFQVIIEAIFSFNINQLKSSFYHQQQQFHFQSKIYNKESKIRKKQKESEILRYIATFSNKAILVVNKFNKKKQLLLLL